MENDIKFDHYWICHKCASDRGGTWPKNHIATVVVRKCQYCDGKNHEPTEFIAPWVDYNWPGKDTRHLRD